MVGGPYENTKHSTCILFSFSVNFTVSSVWKSKETFPSLIGIQIFVFLIFKAKS